MDFRAHNLGLIQSGLKQKSQDISIDEVTRASLYTAASWLEKHLKDDEFEDENRFFSAIGYYLSGHYAQAYVLLSSLTPETPFSVIRQFLRKDIDKLNQACLQMLADDRFSDLYISTRLRIGNYTEATALEAALTATIYKAFVKVCSYIYKGDVAAIEQALLLIDTCSQIGSNVPLSDETFSIRLQCISAVLREFRDNSLWSRLEEMQKSDTTGLVRRYIEASAKRRSPLIELWPSQVVAIPKIIEGAPRTRPNFLVKMPTSAGKTNLAELAFIQSISDTFDTPGGKCIYVAPFNALGAQVEDKLRRHLAPLGIGVSDLYGGFEVSPADPFLFNHQKVLVATPEKVDALLRYSPEFAHKLETFFIDEGHMIDEPIRGLRLEMLIQRILNLSNQEGIRLILASAVLGETTDLAHWLTGREDRSGYVVSHYRPTRNYLGLLLWDGKEVKRKLTHEIGGIDPSYSKISTPTDLRFTVPPKQGQLIAKKPKSTFMGLAYAALREAKEGMTVVFTPRRDWAESITNTIIEILDHIGSARSKFLPFERGFSDLYFPNNFSPAERINRCINLATEMTGSDSSITRALKKGILLHHGKIPKQLRNMLSPLIEEGAFRIVIATNTIIHGVNTPARTVIIHSLTRGNKNTRGAIPTQDFFNLAGRAGRAMEETEGITLLLTTKEKEARSKNVLNTYVSRMNRERVKGALRTLLNNVIEEWRTTYPNADVLALCTELAGNRIDWLSEETRKGIDILDKELLAIHLETGTDFSPKNVENLFSKSLLCLQATEDDDNWTGLQTSLSLLAARVEYLDKIPPNARKAFYRTGLPISDCIVLIENKDQLFQWISTFGQSPNYLPAEVASIIWELYSSYFSKLSIFSDIELPSAPCMQGILEGWILGEEVDRIATRPEIFIEQLSNSEVSLCIEEFCINRIPWAINALRGQIKDHENSETAEAWFSTWSAMVHFGLPSPVAATFFALGLRSRKAAIYCASKYDQLDKNAASLYSWLSSLAASDVQEWNIHDDIKLEIISYSKSLTAIN